MPVEIRFDAGQRYQLDAIAAVVDLFAGQAPGGSVVEPAGLAHPVVANVLTLDVHTRRRNLRRVQDRPAAGSGAGERGPAIPAALRRPFAEGAAPADFSLEMETGTGKTYVYLRTVVELYRRYGFARFAVVVPSVAIREGVLSSLALLRDHLRDLYAGLVVDHYAYDSSTPARVRQFATAPHLQLMVINIDAFASADNLINRPADAMNGHAPIEFLRAVRPIVIMDEPQSMETERRRAAIASLHPLCTVRYSATHRDPQHLVYRLTPRAAYELRLVKRIGVRSVTVDRDTARPYVEIRKITATATGVSATALINRAGPAGAGPATVTLRQDDDLLARSGGLAAYTGWTVADIRASSRTVPGHVRFTNQVVVADGSANDGGRERLHRRQIREAIDAHLARERDLDALVRLGALAPTKVLTLFFIDRVAHYAPADGRLRRWFEAAYEQARHEPRNRGLELPPAELVHAGYFARTASGQPKDVRLERTSGRPVPSAGVDAAFELIMRDKQRLLDRAEPVRFLFSHSALGEGWDNPNVFVICNLQDGPSVVRRRQQLGRGLRLPVMATGERCRIDAVNHLTVIASESFETFAARLQHELAEETGDGGAGWPAGGAVDESGAGSGRPAEPEPGVGDRTAGRPLDAAPAVFATDDLVATAAARVRRLPRIAAPAITVQAAELIPGRSGSPAVIGREVLAGDGQVPDVLTELGRRTPISRATVARILTESGRLGDASRHGSAFLDAVAGAIDAALAELLSGPSVGAGTGPRRPGRVPPDGAGTALPGS